jgi:hypothetical protein
MNTGINEGISFDDAPAAMPPVILCGGLRYEFSAEGVAPLENLDDGTLHALVMASPMNCVGMVDLDRHPEHVTGNPGFGDVLLSGK